MVLEPALGGFSYQWVYAQQELAKFVNVIAYDRAGQGWSDPSTQARTPRQLSHELHILLSKKSKGFTPASLLLNADMRQALAYLGSLPHGGITHVHNNYLLDLLTVE